jgi:hypothetical protein
MKLELKHLAPYLPYKLKYQLYGNFPIKEGVENIVEDTRVIDLKNIQRVLDWETCKPILRPLSDLTEEITHNGEKFVPIDWLEEKYFLTDLPEQCARIIEDDRWVNQSSYMLIEQLIEWHFDVFGLIDNGLAVDINTLQQ